MVNLRLYCQFFCRSIMTLAAKRFVDTPSNSRRTHLGTNSTLVVHYRRRHFNPKAKMQSLGHNTVLVFI